MNARREHWTKASCAIFLVVLVALTATVRVEAGPVEDCNSEDTSRALAGCTALIEGGSLSKLDLATAYARRSDALAETGDLEAAIADRAQAYDLDPSDDAIKTWLAAAYAIRGATFIKNGQSNIALVHYLAAHLLEPDNQTLRTTLVKLYKVEGLARLKEGKFSEAAGYFSHALEVGGMAADILVERAFAYWGASDGARAHEDLAAALRHEPELRSAYLRRAEIYLETGQPEKAIADLNEALRLAPGDGRALVLRALARETIGEHGRASADYLSALEHDPKNRAAVSGLRRVTRDREALVRLVQVELSRAGCDPGPVDGKWGGKSAKALSAFAKHTGASFDQLAPSEAVLEIVAAGKDRSCPTTKGGTVSSAEESGAMRLKTSVKSCITFDKAQYCDFTDPDHLPEPYRSSLSGLLGKTLLCTDTQMPRLQKYIHVTAQRIYVGLIIDNEIDFSGVIYVIGEQKRFDTGESQNTTSTAPLPEGIELGISFVSKQTGYATVEGESQDRLTRVGNLWKYRVRGTQMTLKEGAGAVSRVDHDLECRLMEGRLF